MGREGVGFIAVIGSSSAIEFSVIGLIRSSLGEEEAFPEEIFAGKTLVVIGFTTVVVVG